jgi:hypothetical protein
VIPKIFHLFWSGGPISFMRYATFATLRYHHKDWVINLHLADKFIKNDWANEHISQDFSKSGILDYSPAIRELVDNVRHYNLHPDKAPNHQSDFMRWDVLDEEGGFYLDTDQLILRPFNDLCGHRFIYSNYGNYVPVGVLASEPKLPITHHIRMTLASTYNPTDYNSAGPTMMMKIVKTRPLAFKEAGIFNSERLFYPVYPWEEEFKGIYDGTFTIPSTAYALHWFGGHHLSQEFNRTYVDADVKHGVDLISKTLKDLG